MKKGKLVVAIKTGMLDESIEKANQLIGLLQEAQQILASLSHAIDSPKSPIERQRVSRYGIQYRGEAIYAPEILMYLGRFVEIQDGVIYYDGKEIYRI